MKKYTIYPGVYNQSMLLIPFTSKADFTKLSKKRF